MLAISRAVAADDDTAVRDVSTHDESDPATKLPVEQDDQPLAADDVAAAPAPTADSPESPSGEDEVGAAVVEASTEPATVPDVMDTIDEVAVPAVEVDEAAGNGE